MKNTTTVFINLLAIARYDHMPDYPIQFMTVGQLHYANPGDVQLRYEESQQDDETGEIQKANILLSLRDGRITMERNGDYSNTMVFSKGQRFEGVYHTPYGEMDMAVFTKEAACQFGRSEGNMHLKYQLNIQGSYASTNELHLEYRTEPGTTRAAKGNESHEDHSHRSGNMGHGTGTGSCTERA